MHEFYCDVLQPFFDYQNLKLCMSDTDSLLIKVTTPEEKIRENPDYNIYNAVSEINHDYRCFIDINGLFAEA